MTELEKLEWELVLLGRQYWTLRGAEEHERIAKRTREVNAAIRAIEETKKAPAAPRMARISNFRISEVDGIETCWLEGVTGKRMIHGIASTARHTEIGERNKRKTVSNDPLGCDARFPIPVYSEHDLKGSGIKSPPIGEVVMLQKSINRIFVRCSIKEDGDAADHAWSLIEKGEVASFSVGFHIKELGGIVDGIQFVKRWALAEVTVCRTPANTDCRFEIYEPGDLAPLPQDKAASGTRPQLPMIIGTR